MSQRLHIGETSDQFYDCVVVSQNGIKDKLRTEWFAARNGYYFGPWKIFIGDKELFCKIQPEIKRFFISFKLKYPDDIWKFFYDGKNIEHPTKTELDAWLWPDKEL